ncbi:hypothetical protein [Mesorhizobium sp. WSM2239]|uniref:Uncharacterized protein n=2 Tax=unclassified Mesorhizobium TaxID=325217 RepID=A0AAU8DH84_9HYPH
MIDCLAIQAFRTALSRRVGVLEICGKLRGHTVGWHHHIDKPGIDRTAHHAVVFGSFLRQRQPAMFLDRSQPDGSVAAGP